MIKTDEIIYVAIVEDNKSLRDEVVLYLADEGINIQGFDSGLALDGFIRAKGKLDLLVLDINLPGESGISILKRMRSSQPKLGIIMLSGRTSPVDRIHAYENGADFFLVKPVPAKELESVIRSLFKRINPDKHDDCWNLAVSKRTLHPPFGQKKILLTRRETLVIEALNSSLNKTLSIEEISRLLSPEAELSARQKHIVESAVSRFRIKIKTHLPHDQSEFIQSVWGHGYQLSVELKCK
jgi:DNA-binding response OmpR family regulator